jgi:energy-coupling factor transporter ATP-binding protein EcfA2
VTQRAILLTGHVGSGKTTVLHALDELLAERTEPYALVDLDWLAWVRPSAAATLTVRDALVTNLAALWKTYCRAGVERLVLSRAVQDSEELRAITDTLGSVEIFVARLAVPRTALEGRLRERDSGAQLAEHLAMLDATPSFSAHDVDADRPAAEVAHEILERAGW